MIPYLKKLVDFYPVTSNQASVAALLDFVEQHMQRCGLTVHRHTYNGVHNLYASTSDTKHSDLLLQAHVDVVPGNQPFTADQENCYGRGVYDMLFAVATYMQLADDFSHGNIRGFAVMLSGDEEIGGRSGVYQLLNDEGYTTDLCILPDAGEGIGSLNVAAKGVYNIMVRIQGKAHHGSRPWEGDGAAAKLIHFLADAEALFDTSDKHNSTMTIAQITAGDAMNQGPATAGAVLDIRYKDKDDLARIKHDIKELLRIYDGTITHRSEGSDYQLDTNEPSVQSFISLYEKTIKRPLHFTKAHGSSDARFFSDKGIPVIMFRPDGGGAHGDREWIDSTSYTIFYQLLREYISNLPSTV